MKITSTTLHDKKNLRRPKSYRDSKFNGKATPAIATKTKYKASDYIDPDILDLTGAIDLDKIVIDQMTPTGSKAKAKEERVETVKDILLGIREMGKNVPRPKIKATKLKDGSASICCLFSDWHYGKVIKTKTGRHIFDSKIAHNRISNELPEQIVEYILSMAKSKKIDEIRLLFAGDIVDNDIVYATQRLQIDSGVAVQFTGAIQAIMTMITTLREKLSFYGIKVPIKLDCIVGNHGRAGATSEVPVCSWDTAVYAALDLAVKTAKWTDVEVTFSLEDFHVFNVRGHRGLMVHHAPPTSETTAGKRKFGGWKEIFDFDFAVYGDLHHWAAHCYNGTPLLMNGSLCGYDEYAIGLGVRDDWSQLVWMATDESPVTYLHRLERKQ